MSLFPAPFAFPFGDDMVGPRLASVTPQGPTVVRVAFDRPMAQDADLTDVRNYSVLDGPGELAVVAVAVVDPATVDVTTEEHLQGGSYTLRVSFVRDTNGFEIVPGSGRDRLDYVGTGAPPQVALIAPANGATGVGRGASIVLEVTDPDSGVELASLEVDVEGQSAYAAGTFYAPYDNAGSDIETLADGFRVTLAPAPVYAFSQVVNVSVTATDNAGNQVL